MAREVLALQQLGDRQGDLPITRTGGSRVGPGRRGTSAASMPKRTTNEDDAIGRRTQSDNHTETLEG